MEHSGRAGASVWWWVLLGCVGAVGFIGLLPVVSVASIWSRPVWTREHPLVAPVLVREVRGRELTLADGRRLVIAGIKPRGDLPAGAFEEAVRAACAQGVEVTRETGEGRASFLCEAAFYNWCGTGRARGGRYWAGSFFRCPLAELLIVAGYAEPAAEEEGLTSRERWRLEGAAAAWPEVAMSGPVRIGSPGHVAFRYDSTFRFLEDYDVSLGLIWRPPPEP